MISSAISIIKLKGRDDGINLDSDAGISPEHQIAFTSL